MDVVVDLSPVCSRPDRPRRWPVLVGPLGGLAVGLVARWWMRLIADAPAFTWSGTLVIVAAFTVAGTGLGIAWAGAGARARSASTVARVVGGTGTMALFTGAGAIMLPTVV